ncbi:MAG: carboxymuconolactone decarboxylase family protein [Methylovulum miyakonense]|uniref:carboxymuconolactone decarboxylase family protein n=1 Tax=Methylovulum miyakonense TaxID=645578 RepID=UPI000370BC1D|nr:carboxymuconolactone decarboxylase family protein [Methylovulum miyakonense]
MNISDAVNYQQVIPEIFGALAEVHAVMDATGLLDRKLHHLVQLRASQINQCAYCVQMHTGEARTDGESNARLDQLVVWERSDAYSPAEQAALAWAEALTTLQKDTDYTALRIWLREHFSDAQIGVLTSTVAMINLWNRIQISTH